EDVQNKKEKKIQRPLASSTQTTANSQGARRRIPIKLAIASAVVVMGIMAYTSYLRSSDEFICDLTFHTPSQDELLDMLNTAQGMYETGRYQDAKQLCDRVLGYAPQLKTAWQLRGLVHSELGD